ncbi:NADH:ubiquinone oxidoreductase 24 kD subunit [Halobacteroides halobius DSM 5150]|uniref:NADH:ubiquinone oxidoreductase 24 kD subunit n=1 Tax=Halobacteroides halobius (strain ATCC 35273 / DSM 5150 / MD-1) TaxID=748449 RepID=L0K696_HALHC|nr:NAD(P)H-dependent oxidoreductase subunit E [Halobacteroides halobius]AGB40060.1 NADH:ubiquinone oxidoreductase 24 kD subunit [Halobacteroides halobius DSM 5150]
MKLKVCIGTPCHLMGAQNLISAVKEFSHKKTIKLDIEAVNCLDNCKQAPAVELDGKVYAPSTPQELIELIENRL